MNSLSPAAAPAGALVKDATTRSFAADVLQESQNQPVVVDFWAPWCGPCRQLTPVLEKTVNAAKGAVKLVKINIDENPEIAQHFRVQSIRPSTPSGTASPSTASSAHCPRARSDSSSSASPRWRAARRTKRGP